MYFANCLQFQLSLFARSLSEIEQSNGNTVKSKSEKFIKTEVAVNTSMITSIVIMVSRTHSENRIFSRKILKSF